MALHTDIPTRAQIERLLTVREPSSVSIYVPTSPVTQEAQGDRIAFKNLVSASIAQLHAAGADKHDVAAIEEALHELHDDDGFWALQANSLAVFATPSSLRTFRLPNQLTETVQVSDRFHVKPLLRAVTFPQSAFVLSLAQGAVSLHEVSPDLPTFEVHVPDLPRDAASAAGKASITDRSASGTIQGSEGQKVLMRQYARKVDHALRPVLAGHQLPLILAATAPLDAIFRSVNSYPHLADEGLPGNPEARSETEIGSASRAVLDDLYAAELRELTALFEARGAQGRAATEQSDIARAATFGAVDTLFVDIDVNVPGYVDEQTGAISLGADDASDYGVLDELARRVLLSDGRVLAVRHDEVPGDGPAAAILRYPV